jgi:2-alkenal reductase
MAGARGSRLRKVALTGALTPGLVLGAMGAVGFGIIPVGMGQSASAQSVLNSGNCTAFGSSAAASATEMSVADVAEQANPAVVTIINLQQMSQADLSGFSGIEGIPGLPEMPDIGELPDVDEMPSDEGVEGARQIDGSEDDTAVPVGSGSGFIVDELGHVVTNAHVVDGAEELTVVLADGTEIPGTVVGSEPFLDVAVVQLDLPSGFEVPAIASFGDSESLRAGEQVVAIGNALGSFPNTVSEGTVNATDRSFGTGLSTMIQHDAEIWHGNSGGPLLNLRAEVVGINTAGIGSSTMGLDAGSADMAFAVEGNTVCSAAAELIENGEIVWPYMGIQGEQSGDGQVVAEVVTDGPSAEAGLEVGDVITAFDGQAIDNQHTLLDLLFDREPGDVVNVEVDRDGSLETFQVTLGERPEITE